MMFKAIHVTARLIEGHTLLYKTQYGYSRYCKTNEIPYVALRELISLLKVFHVIERLMDGNTLLYKTYDSCLRLFTLLQG